MRDGMRIGRLFGVALTLDFSWILIFLLMTWNLSAIFWHWHPDWGMGNIGIGVVASLLFFGSVVAHELGHALVATGFGLRVREIRLFLFGGVSDIEREPPSPGAEALIALVGPAVSLAIGFLCLLIASFFLRGLEGEDSMTTLSRLGPLESIIVWLGPVNVFVALFNLIPGFPLDGGRVLRAILWKATGDLTRATRVASGVGQAIGWTFIVMGIAMVFGARVPFFGQGPSGLWLAFIGWFLSSAASRSYRGLVVTQILEGVSVSTLMRRSGSTLPSGTMISAAVTDSFMRSSEHMFPVMRGDDFIGLVCVGDVRRAPQAEWETTPVDAVMTPLDRLVTVSPTDDVSLALRKLAELDVEQLPVLADGHLVGMLERTAVSRWLEMHVAPSARPVARPA